MPKALAQIKEKGCELYVKVGMHLTRLTSPLSSVLALPCMKREREGISTTRKGSERATWEDGGRESGMGEDFMVLTYPKEYP